ncbi:MAG: heme-binding protein [Gammaproteobacteria bacterium]|nr:heme-binding protein [Gammaproteobacteria bacterium]
MRFLKISIATATLFSAGAVFAQAPAPPPAPLPYGPALSLTDARACAGAVQAEAVKNQWLMVVAVVDSGGHSVLTERMDNAQFGSVVPAQKKATGAVAFRRPTKFFEDLIAQGGAALRILTLPGVLPIDGGLPIIRDGHIIGGVGVSGGTSQQDGLAAAACQSMIK